MSYSISLRRRRLWLFGSPLHQSLKQSTGLKSLLLILYKKIQHCIMCFRNSAQITEFFLTALKGHLFVVATTPSKDREFQLQEFLSGSRTLCLWRYCSLAAPHISAAALFHLSDSRRRKGDLTKCFSLYLSQSKWALCKILLSCFTSCRNLTAELRGFNSRTRAGSAECELLEWGCAGVNR